MRNKRGITEGEAKLLAAILLAIVVAVATGATAWISNVSFETWLGMFFFTLVSVVIVIYMMAS